VSHFKRAAESCMKRIALFISTPVAVGRLRSVKARPLR
jgi:hypothetical protein